MNNDHFEYCELRDLNYQINPRRKFKFKEANLSTKKDFTLQMCSAVHGKNGNSKLFSVYRKFITHLPCSCQAGPVLMVVVSMAPSRGEHLRPKSREIHRGKCQQYLVNLSNADLSVFVN